MKQNFSFNSHNPDKGYAYLKMKKLRLREDTEVVQGHTEHELDPVQVSPKLTLLTIWIVKRLPRLGGCSPSQTTLLSGDKFLQGKENLDPLPAPQGTSRPGPSALFACTAQRLCSNSKVDCCSFTSWTPKPLGKAKIFWHLIGRENAFSLGTLLETVCRIADNITIPVPWWEAKALRGVWVGGWMDGRMDGWIWRGG